MIIVVRDALDGRSFPEAGDYVYNLMLPFADTDEEFVLDLQGVSDLPSLFFNMCLKRFVEGRGTEFVKSRVRFKNISRSQAARVVDYVEKVCRP